MNSCLTVCVYFILMWNIYAKRLYIVKDNNFNNYLLFVFRRNPSFYSCPLSRAATLRHSPLRMRRPPLSRTPRYAIWVTRTVLYEDRQLASLLRLTRHFQSFVIKDTRITWLTWFVQLTINWIYLYSAGNSLKLCFYLLDLHFHGWVVWHKWHLHVVCEANKIY